MTRGVRRLTLLGALLLGSVALATVDDGIRYYNNKDYASAAREFMTAAFEGDPSGQHWIGYLYSNGLGVHQDYTEAAKWYRAAADKQSGAAVKLGSLYLNGLGLHQDYSQALNWFLRAANSGDAEGMNLVGWIYHNGYGVKQDYAEAYKWYVKSAAKENPNAQTNLGFLFRNGYGVPQNYKQALYWYNLAANQGDPGSQYRMGWLYENGLASEKNIPLALEWYRKSAAQDNQLAKDALARLNAAAAQPAPRPTATTATTPLPTDTTKKQVALLIGNQAYPSSRLNNPINDVNKLGATLKSLGFTVIVKTDLNRRDLLSTVRTFLNTIDRNTVSFLYYSGHGMEVGGRNYLIPIDFDAATPEEIDDQGVDIQKLYDGLPGKAAGSDNFLVLDACRNNPLAVTKSLSDSGGVKAVAMRAPFIDTNLVVAYAASSGQKASDGVGNSPYVLALNTALLTPNISWTTMLGNVSKTLRASSQGRQVPAYLSQGGFEFVFNRR